MPIVFSLRAKANIFILTAVIIWAAATPVIKATVGIVPPFTFLMLRFWISAVFLIPPAVYFYKTVKISKENLKHIVITAILGNVLALIFYFTGLKRTGAVEGSILSSLSPLIISIMGYLVLHEVITRKEIKGTLIALAGSLFIIFEPFFLKNSTALGEKIVFTGNLLFIFGILCDASYTIYVKKYLSQSVSPAVMITFGFLITAVIFTPLGFLEQAGNYRNYVKNLPPACNPSNLDQAVYDSDYKCDEKYCYSKNEVECQRKGFSISFGRYFAGQLKEYSSSESNGKYGIIYMALFSGIIAYILYLKGLKLIEASETSVFTYLQPVIAIPLAVVFLKENISIVFVIGAILIIYGIFTAERRK
ncbi:hypothetical protein A2982_02825 [candidate division WWE3 bacterium RIFCSPLOWO2_01_FULL_39_13]|uniref:EamA domain-containing protein n=1 Tax=candidate division WWE3 bacterium RIFCSPLOWO2_01_FULL_39_13 TaxID=1802624 RepID=A0A1F4V4K9_UNCKA|nr:MAG: hypothetical protein A2982_02825 [candidate division WWE3 bacterium RIFCSPLOWO2_01_FULL_39_13]